MKSYLIFVFVAFVGFGLVSAGWNEDKQSLVARIEALEKEKNAQQKTNMENTNELLRMQKIINESMQNDIKKTEEINLLKQQVDELQTAKSTLETRMVTKATKSELLHTKAELQKETFNVKSSINTCATKTELTTVKADLKTEIKTTMSALEINLAKKIELQNTNDIESNNIDNNIASNDQIIENGIASNLVDVLELKGFTKILVTTGEIDYDASNKTEIIDLMNPNVTCPKWPDFPKRLVSAIGGLLDNVPVICGGRREYENSLDCFTLTGNLFQATGSLSTDRMFSAGVVINGSKLWITGGRYSNSRNTEYISKEGVSSPGPELQKNLALGPDPDLDNAPSRCPIHSHSMTNINLTTTIITGGAYYMSDWHQHQFSSLVYYFHHQIQKWVEGPELNVARNSHASGMVTDTVTKERYLVVAGGSDGRSNLDSTEILISNEWIIGPKMPQANYGHSLVPFGDSLVLLGGTNGDKRIYKLNCSNRICKWTKMPQRLSASRERFVAIPIPDSLANC